MGALLVYDITKHPTFDNLDRWLKELQKFAESNIVVMLIGNKTDLESLRAITSDSGKKFAEENHLLFIETSAKDTINVDLAFNIILSEIFSLNSTKKINTDSLKFKINGGENIDQNSNQSMNQNSAKNGKSNNCC
eukprot:Anaeramoba_ignava/c17486_g1_i2.p1 GENE.c17486_g1_i2~~c17486_g1_i2.p1  ORF type:complete len:135 (+),score=48.35 c17486_g1_i2:211-615(+)